MKLTDAQISHLVEAYIKLSREQGMFAFSLTELCKASGLSNGTFYRNIHSRDDLLILSFSQIVSMHNNFIFALEASELNLKERLICQIVYPSYYSKMNIGSFGINFLGANKGLIKNAQPQLLQQLQGLYNELLYIHRRVFVEIERRLQEHTSKQQLSRLFKTIMLLSRGGAVINNNPFAANARLKTDEFIDLVEDLINSLPWPEDCQQLRREKIKTFLRSSSDQGLRLNV